MVFSGQFVSMAVQATMEHLTPSLSNIGTAIEEDIFLAIRADMLSAGQVTHWKD
jgi:hypothetical protein